MKSEKLYLYILDGARVNGFMDRAYAFYLGSSVAKSKPQAEAIMFARHKSEQACWFYSIAKGRQREAKSLGFPGKYHLYHMAMLLMAEQANLDGWHSWKCKSLYSLYKRLKPFKRIDGNEEKTNVAFQSLISGKMGNDNAARLGAEQQALIIVIYGDGITKPTFERTLEVFNLRAEAMSKLGYWNPEQSKISLSNLRVLLNKPAVKKLWSESRESGTLLRRIYQVIPYKI